MCSRWILNVSIWPKLGDPKRPCTSVEPWNSSAPSSAVMALTETTGKLAKGLKELASRWSNAPEEVKALSVTSSQLAVKFAFVQDTVANSHALLDDVIRQGLMQLVTEAKAATEELEILQKKLEEHGSAFQRTRWAVKDARTAKRISNTVKDIEEGLSEWIDYITLYDSA